MNEDVSIPILKTTTALPLPSLVSFQGKPSRFVRQIKASVSSFNLSDVAFTLKMATKSSS